MHGFKTMNTPAARSRWSVVPRSGTLWLSALVVWMLGAAPAPADFIVRPVNLAYLAQRADVIVQGRVSQVRYEALPGYPHIPTVLVTLEVERMLRGSEGERYAFRQLLLPSQMRAGKNAYRVGQRLLLFLPSPSSLGLSSPIGHEQGRFHILRDARGREVIENEFANAGLFRNVAEQAEKSGAGLNQAQMRVAATPRGSIALPDLVSLVEHLMLLPRIP